METKTSFRDYVRQGDVYRYEGRDPDPSAKRITAGLGAATIIAPWAIYTLVDPDIGAVAAAQNIATEVFFAYSATALALSLLVFGRGQFLVAAKNVVAVLLPFGLAHVVFNHSDAMAPFYDELGELTYHRVGIVLLIGAYAAFLFDLVRNGLADTISRSIWKRDGAQPASRPAPAEPAPIDNKALR